MTDLNQDSELAAIREEWKAATDDSCYGRCDDLRNWFAWATRGTLVPEESHEILDMLLNRLASEREA